MGSSFYPSSKYSFSYGIPGPVGSTGERGPTGPTGYGSTGPTGSSISSMGLCGGKLLTTFDTGATYITSANFKGSTGNTVLIAGITVGNGLSIYAGETRTLNFRKIRGITSLSGRADFQVGLCGDSLEFSYINLSSGFTLGITGSETVNTFIGYSGSAVTSIQKSRYGESSSISTRNIFEKARGLGYSGATSSTGVLCNYITGGTFNYIDSKGSSASAECKIVYINPDCVSKNSIDVEVRNKVFVADMKNNTTLVVLGETEDKNSASAITVVLMNPSNGPTASALGQKRFSLTSATGDIMWPFGVEPCFCGPTGTNVYHFFNVGGYTWYGSVAWMSDTSVFFDCQKSVIQGISVPFGACCIADGTPGGTCIYESITDCLNRGASAFWHAGLTCGSNPCQKTGGCCMSFTDVKAENSSLCLNGITCINCISGMVYNPRGKTYNATSFTYLGNGITCSSSNCPVGAENVI
jgi:hypothetical protein